MIGVAWHTHYGHEMALPPCCCPPCPALCPSGPDLALPVSHPRPADLNFLYLSSRLLEWVSPDLARTSLSGARDVAAWELDPA